MKDTLLDQYGVIGRIARTNLDGVGEEHCRQNPQPGGNNLNWVLGHLVDTYNSFLPLIGQEQVWTGDEGKPYARFSNPLAVGEGLPWNDLLAAWETVESRFLAGLDALPDERWDEAAPFSPRENPDETLGSFLGILVFHQAYHVGQLGILRRSAGLGPAIK